MKSLQWRRKQWETVRSVLIQLYPNRRTELHYRTPWQLLVATILSAQCTDDRVNTVTDILFAHYPDVNDYVKMDNLDLESIIFSTGFYRAKSKHIIESSRRIATQFGGNVPSTMAELITLPGVARKTANVVLQNCFNILVGIAVDTHIIRFALRFGLSESNNADTIEQDLMNVIEQGEWMVAGYWIKEYGRQFGRPYGNGYSALIDPLVEYRFLLE